MRVPSCSLCFLCSVHLHRSALLDNGAHLRLALRGCRRPRLNGRRFERVVGPCDSSPLPPDRARRLAAVDSRLSTLQLALARHVGRASDVSARRKRTAPQLEPKCVIRSHDRERLVSPHWLLDFNRTRTTTSRVSRGLAVALDDLYNSTDGRRLSCSRPAPSQHCATLLNRLSFACTDAIARLCFCPCMPAPAGHAGFTLNAASFAVRPAWIHP